MTRKAQEGLALVGMVLTLALIVFAITRDTVKDIVEVRNEHLIFEAPSCKVYQVVIRNEHGKEIVYVTTPGKSDRQTAYPACRVTK